MGVAGGVGSSTGASVGPGVGDGIGDGVGDGSAARVGSAGRVSEPDIVGTESGETTGKPRSAEWGLGAGDKISAAPDVSTDTAGAVKVAVPAACCGSATSEADVAGDAFAEVAGAVSVTGDCWVLQARSPRRARTDIRSVPAGTRPHRRNQPKNLMYSVNPHLHPTGQNRSPHAAPVPILFKKTRPSAPGGGAWRAM